MRATEAIPRNPGPTWGFRFLQVVQALPRPLLQPLLMLGTWVAVAVMPEQRRHSRNYLSCVLGRPARIGEVWRHFFRYLDFLLLRLRIAGGARPVCRLAPENAVDFEALMASGEPALFGTFHFGHSDLLGFLLAEQGRRVAMIRLRVTNSADTGMLQRQFGRVVSYIWVNEPENLLFALKTAIERGESIALQCDRLYGARAEQFHFLDGERLFPFTAYHLAILFQRPVMFCVGLPDSGDATRVCPFPIFRPDPAAGREANLQRARMHFQAVLGWLETLVRQHPTLWFNFLPLNPEAAPSPESVTAKSSRLE